MSHRAGRWRAAGWPLLRSDSPPLVDVVKSLAGTTLVFEPGTRTKYSNAGLAVVGAVVERVAGQPFPQADRSDDSYPLGMTRSSFEPGPDLMRQMAHGVMWT